MSICDLICCCGKLVTIAIRRIYPGGDHSNKVTKATRYVANLHCSEEFFFPNFDLTDLKSSVKVCSISFDPPAASP